MSDTPQGPGWWQASDDKWYPPPRPDMPSEQVAGPASGPPQAGYQGGPPAAFQSPPSPYGQVPSHAPPGSGGANRTLLYTVIGVIGVLAVAVVIVLLMGDDEEGGPTTGPDDSTPASSADGPCEREDLGDDLVLVECGFSTVQDSSGTLPTYGFVIENTGSEMRQYAQFTVVLYDEDDKVVDTGEVSITSIPPGATMGYGETPYAWDSITGTVADIDVSYGGLRDSLGSSDLGEGSFEVSNVKSSQDTSSVNTTYNVSSTYAEQVDSPKSYVIFRNADGEVIGGDNGYSPSFIAPDARTGGKLQTFAVFEDMDPEKTEVYVDLAY